MEKNKVSPFVLDDALTNLHSTENKAEVLKTVRKGKHSSLYLTAIKLRVVLLNTDFELITAVEKGQLSPDVLEDILADLDPEDNKSHVMKKVHKGMYEINVRNNITDKTNVMWNL